MGYLHRGMLPDGVDKVVDKLKPGEVSEPVHAARGRGAAEAERAQGRAAAQLPAKCASARATCGSARKATGAGRSCIADLRKATPVRINESLYMPLPKPAAPKAG